MYVLVNESLLFTHEVSGMRPSPTKSCVKLKGFPTILMLSLLHLDPCVVASCVVA